MGPGLGQDQARIRPRSGKPKHASTLLQLIDAKTGDNGSKSISTMSSVEDGEPWAPEVPFSRVRRARAGLFGDVSGFLDRRS